DFQYFRKPSGDNLKQLQAIKGMSAQKSLVGFNIFFSFNLKAPSVKALLDKRVRQAFVWALDRHTLVDDVLGGVFKVPDIMNHWIAPWANSDKLEKYDPQDTAKAKDLLTKAGYNGETIQAWVYPPKFDPDIPVIAQMWN